VNATSHASSLSLTHNPFLGAWRLLECYVSADDYSERNYPFGRDAQGLMLYGDTQMSVQMMRQGRPKYCGKDRHCGGMGEMATSAAGYMAYTGSYAFDASSSIMTHYVETSLNPEWVGMPLERLVILQDNTLELRTVQPLDVNGEKVYTSLVWARV
jgi:hypothetical protein